MGQSVLKNYIDMKNWSEGVAVVKRLNSEFQKTASFLEKAAKQARGTGNLLEKAKEAYKQAKKDYAHVEKELGRLEKELEKLKEDDFINDSQEIFSAEELLQKLGKPTLRAKEELEKDLHMFYNYITTMENKQIDRKPAIYTDTFSDLVKAVKSKPKLEKDLGGGNLRKARDWIFKMRHMITDFLLEVNSKGEDASKKELQEFVKFGRPLIQQIKQERKFLLEKGRSLEDEMLSNIHPNDAGLLENTHFLDDLADLELVLKRKVEDAIKLLRKIDSEFSINKIDEKDEEEDEDKIDEEEDEDKIDEEEDEDKIDESKSKIDAANQSVLERISKTNFFTSSLSRLSTEELHDLQGSFMASNYTLNEALDKAISRCKALDGNGNKTISKFDIPEINEYKVLVKAVKNYVKKNSGVPANDALDVKKMKESIAKISSKVSLLEKLVEELAAKPVYKSKYDSAFKTSDENFGGKINEEEDENMDKTDEEDVLEEKEDTVRAGSKTDLKRQVDLLKRQVKMLCDEIEELKKEDEEDAVETEEEKEKEAAVDSFRSFADSSPLKIYMPKINSKDSLCKTYSKFLNANREWVDSKYKGLLSAPPFKSFLPLQKEAVADMMQRVFTSPSVTSKKAGFVKTEKANIEIDRDF